MDYIGFIVTPRKRTAEAYVYLAARTYVKTFAVYQSLYGQLAKDFPEITPSSVGCRMVEQSATHRGCPCVVARCDRGAKVESYFNVEKLPWVLSE